VITFRSGKDLDLDQVIDLYRVSTLGARRPVDNRETMRKMVENADLIVTAWDEKRLVGIARTLTDFAYVAYLADLAVDQNYQNSGIGKQLIDETRNRLEPGCMITLLAAPGANAYYPKVGFEHNPRAWVLRNRS
jgi:predicted N-acetyltransferase YhbS